MLERVVRRVFRRRGVPTPMDPGVGYDLWSSTYDEDTQNLIVIMDEVLFGGLLDRVDLRAKSVLDVGCGTGRHWNKILAREPVELTGYDPSAGMLTQLRRKHPRAVVYQGTADHLVYSPDRSVDCVVSTLALSHVEAAEAALREWVRVLRPGGDVLLTDFHPAVASRGHTTFQQAGRWLSVKLHVHSFATLKGAAARNHLQLLARCEQSIDESMKHHYERADRLHLFHRFRGVPHVYGLHLRKES